jgi:N-ethylmaleimide reductase
MQNLFSPICLGSLELQNRILMAPLTRCRANPGHIPSDLMVEYYRQRASAGLIIAEATMAMEGNSAFWREPGIYSEEQVVAWRKVTDAVHKEGGKIFLQIWHGGRACHPLLNEGRIPVAPSAIAISVGTVQTPSGKLPYVTPRALEDQEIPSIIVGFRKAAHNAITAGFDGVEVHGANGYLIDEFLRDGSNKREGKYGGSLENRARLLFEILETTIDVCGPDRVGLRISPLNSFNSMIDRDPIALSSYLANQLNKYPIAYLHLMRSDFLGQQSGDVITPVRSAFKGTLICNMGYSAEEANKSIADGQIDAVAFGTQFIANPDLPARFLAKADLNAADPDTFYTEGPIGYTDYASM